MWSEFLKLIPTLDSASLDKMTKNLSGRFASVAKKFGTGLKNILLGGGIVGAAAGILNKILNPLKDTQEALEKTLGNADDLVTAAQELDTTSGKLAKLQALGVSTGLEPEQLRMLIQRFQSELLKARLDEIDPTKTEKDKNSLLRNFIGDPRKPIDVGDAFFDFIQALQHETKERQVLVQNEIFGEKLRGKSSEFLNLNFADQLKKIGGDQLSSQTLTEAINKIGNLNDLKDIATAQRGLTDFVTKAGIVNESMINSIDKRADEEVKRENSRLTAFNNLAATQSAMDQLNDRIEKAFTSLSQYLPTIIGIFENLGKAATSYLSDKATGMVGGSTGPVIPGVGALWEDSGRPAKTLLQALGDLKDVIKELNQSPAIRQPGGKK